MFTSLWIRWTALVATLALWQRGATIRAQQPPPGAPAYNPNATYGRPTSQTQGTAQLTTATPLAPSVNVAGYAPPPAYVAPAYGYVPYYSSPMEGYLNGAANVTTANAQYQVTIQQARLLREQSYQASLETRRRTLEEHQYELAMRPTPEQIRAREQQQAIERSLNTPPPVEIWSGQALNTLLDTIKQGLARGARGARVPLPQDALPQINFTTGATSGNVGIFKQGGGAWNGPWS